MNAINLRTEYLKNPVGVDFTSPRLMWNCEGGVRQSAFQIIARQEETLLWDTGKVQSSSMRVIYEGALLNSRDRVVWQVRLWDEKDCPGPWESAFFELGLLFPTDWSASWITGNYHADKKKRYPVDYFRKQFRAGSVQKARLYITACGLYEAKLNGQRVGDFIMAPGHTDYRKRVQVQTYDVTDQILSGENELVISLGDGWYRGSCGAWGLTVQYGTETKLLAQLELTEGDGKVRTIVSDETWVWSNDGPIRFADNQDGEHVDARKRPSFSGHAKRTSHPVTPTASDNVPVTEHERFSPVLLRTPTGKKVLDFGQNIAGYVEFSVSAHAGERLYLRFGEMLDKAGEFTQKNIQCAREGKITPLQEVKYICKEGENHYKTTFAVFGFRYVQVEADFPIKPEDFTAIAVYSDLEQTGFFTSSNELLNRFVDCVLWSTKNNSLDVPTDCPTRERHGWTGDAQLFSGTAAFLFDYTAFSRKYLRDMYDWQRKDGCLPQIAPYGGVDFYMDTLNGSVGWSDAGILIPYCLWKQNGDLRLIAEHYPGMKRYAKFMMKRCGKWTPLSKKIPISGKAKRYLVNYGQSYGEWAEPKDVYPNDWRDMVQPHPEVSTAYTSYVMRCMAEIAAALGKKEDEAEYKRYAKGCRKAYRQLRKVPEFSLDTDRQALLVRPLAFHLLTKKQTTYARQRLLKAMDHYGWRIGTGFLSTPFILDVLAEIDIEAAYRLLENEEMPGWLFMPKNGATTIWESWEGTESNSGVDSLDHYSKGACVKWLFTTMCGIHMEEENQFLIAPEPGGHFTHAAAKYRSVYGEVQSSWEKKDGTVTYFVKIPANCTARILLPGGRQESVTAGEYRFTEEGIKQQ